VNGHLIPGAFILLAVLAVLGALRVARIIRGGGGWYW
jgi:hypothetical protein